MIAWDFYDELKIIFQSNEKLSVIFKNAMYLQDVGDHGTLQITFLYYRDFFGKTVECFPTAFSTVWNFPSA